MVSSIPNLITFLRLLLAVPIGISIYLGNDFQALMLFIVAGTSDWLDGFIARKFNWESKSGLLLDPLADKCLILSTLLALAFAGKLPIWLVSILLARDAIIVMGSMFYFMLFDESSLVSNRWGKHYTGWTIALFIIVLLHNTLEAWPSLYYALLEIAKFGVLLFTFFSLSSYFRRPGKKIFSELFRK